MAVACQQLLFYSAPASETSVGLGISQGMNKKKYRRETLCFMLLCAFFLMAYNFKVF